MDKHTEEQSSQLTVHIKNINSFCSNYQPVESFENLHGTNTTSIIDRGVVQWYSRVYSVPKKVTVQISDTLNTVRYTQWGTSYKILFDLRSLKLDHRIFAFTQCIF